jgi:hypothetical protein
MAATHSIRVDLPDDLYRQVREAAARSDQPVEAVLLGSLELLFGDPPGGWDQLEASLESLPDEQLWALVYRRMAWPDGARLRELTARGQRAPLAEAEQAELASLIDESDRYALLRSRALLLLKGRGHDVEARLKLGA